MGCSFFVWLTAGFGWLNVTFGFEGRKMTGTVIFQFYATARGGA
jgi:hypothetical protein